MFEQFKANPWMFRMFVFLVIVAAFFAVNYFHLKSRIDHLWTADVVIEVEEENALTNVPAYVGPIPSSDQDGLPIFYSLQSKSESPTNWRFLITSDRPQDLEVSAKGFKSERVTIQESGSREIKVKLKKNE
jgi:hypothetical protein